MRSLFILFILFSISKAVSLPTSFDMTPDIAPQANFQHLNPDLKHRPDYLAGQAVSIKASLDKKTLLILTSGYNRMHNSDGTLDVNASNEYVFIYDVSHHTPIKKQVIQIPNTFYGIAWHPQKDAFYVSGGVNDVIYFFEKENKDYVKKATLSLGHQEGLGIRVKPMASEIALNASGSLLAVSNLENDSISLIDTQSFKVLDEIDLRPGKNDAKKRGVAGGEFPFGVAFADDKIYVSSMRDYEVVVLTYKDNNLSITKRIAVGSQPTRLHVNTKEHELFVANSRSDSISVINTLDDTIKGSFYTTAPKRIFDAFHLKGANPNSMRLYKDELYVTNGGTNSVSVIKLKRKKNKIAGNVIALYPTGWYPNDLELIDNYLYVVNGKSLSGPNVGDCRDTLSIAPDALKPCTGRNLYTFKTKKAGFLSMPLPDEEEQDRLTLQVANNNKFFQDNKLSKTMKFLQKKIKHIIYVVKENRSYDQVLGDLEVGNGDKNLSLFPETMTPNHHQLARQFVTLDNFLDSGSASNDGWVWTTSGHTTEYTEKNIMINYARRGLSYDNEGENRNIPLAYGDLKSRQKTSPRMPNDPDLLPGIRDVSSVDGDDEAPAEGYIWNKALEAGLQVRNYGFYCDEKRYYLDHNDSAYIPPSPTPYQDKMVQAYSNKPALLDISDPYFRGFDMTYPDLWRYHEFKREFDNDVKAKHLPNLLFVRLPHDHFGSFGTALAGVDTPPRQIADNDYAVGLLVESVAKSPFADSTLIFIIEDDAQNGADHVSSHRSICLVAGPYVKKHAVISTRYTTVNVLKTMESILQMKPIGLNDALAENMDDIFDVNASSFTYKSKIPDVLYTTQLRLPKKATKIKTQEERLDHNKSYWEEAMRGQNFQSEDQLNVKVFNQALWKGIKKDPLPSQLQ